MSRFLDFVIIGAQRAGSTSLHRYLAAHPDIYLPREKEVPFFGDAAEFRRGPERLDRHFRGRTSESIAGLSYVGMMFLDGTAERLHEYDPRMKIVAILRNPVDRAYSAYWYHRRTGWDDSPSFEAALVRERDGRLSSDAVGDSMAYLRNGCYMSRLRPFVERFGQKRVHLLLTEDLKERPVETLRGLASWLGARGEFPAHAFDARHNVSAMPRLPRLQRMLMASGSPLKRFYRSSVPSFLRRAVRTQVTTRIARWNERPFLYPEMDSRTRESLVQYYQPHNERLARFLSRDLGAGARDRGGDSTLRVAARCPRPHPGRLIPGRVRCAAKFVTRSGGTACCRRGNASTCAGVRAAAGAATPGPSAASKRGPA